MTVTQSYTRAIRYFREDAGKIVLSLVLIGTMTLLGLLQPFPLAILIDSVLDPEVGTQRYWVHELFFRFAPDEKLGQIISLAAITLGLHLAQALLSMWQTLLKIRIGYNGLVRVRCDLFRKLQELSLSYHRSKPQGDAIYRLSYDTTGFQGAVNTVTGILVNVATLITMAVIMFTMNWQLALVALSVAPLLMLTIKYFGKRLKQHSIFAKETDTKLTTAMQRSVSSIGLVQAFGREQDEIERFTGSVNSSVHAWLKLHRQEVTYWLTIGAISGLGTALIFGYGGYLVLRDDTAGLGEKGMTAGFLYVFISYLGKLYGPLNSLSGTGATLQSGAAGIQRVLEILDLEPVIRDAPNAVHLPRQPRVLELDNVGFEYRPGEPVLREVSVTIKPGQMVAFVGSSGVGKTTLLNLLPRFYDPVTGALKLDGHDLRSVKVKDLRKHVALVLQESVILPTSVYENIGYGRPDATPEQIRHAAQLAGADEFIRKLPDGYDTQVTESGQNLSGGQRQRIGIARALATEAPILVLDEPTSALDPQNEQMITETLRGLKRHRTVLIVSHRLSTVSDCDVIFVMDEGRIVEQGTHDDLVKRRGLYFRMAKHQMKLEDDDPQITQISQIGAGK